MANRTKSDAPQHETIPGPGPAKVSDGGSGIHPVEQMVDAAIERLAREHQASRDIEPRHTLAVRTSRPDGTGRLRWKGLDVSDEFRQYAERIAQGEDLPPYEGKILAEPHPTFPWEPSQRKRASRRALISRIALWSSAAGVAGLLSWSLAVRFTNPAPSASTSIATSVPPARAADEHAPSQAVLSIQGGAELPMPGQSKPPESMSGQAMGNNAYAVTADGAPAASPGGAHTAPTAESRPAMVARPAFAPRPAPQANASSGARAERERVPEPYVPPPGALREALGALLAARAEPEEFPLPNATSAESDDKSPVADPTPGKSAGTASARHVRKEPESKSSDNESLLVEIPSF